MWPARARNVDYVARMPIHALTNDVVERARDGAVALVATGGEPLRCCLRNARAGEAILLFSYEPPIGDGRSPYREVGAVFAHAAPCEAPTGGAYPAAWLGKPQVLRAYDARGWIVDALVHDGKTPEPEIARLFAQESVVEIHSRNVAYGCFMFRITR
ncbi:MAG TPA: DUF1203 domain-containing protein [Polyangia bacterium]|jgi:hypothetical protein